VVVIHNDNRSSDSCRLEKTISGIILDDATIPALSAAPAAQVEAAQQARQLLVVEFHARWAAGRQFKDAAFQSLEAGITMPSFLWR
jgi:hypothetical protein